MRARPSVDSRARLLGAMVAAVAEHGYEATRVVDLLEIAGVSRDEFDRHFDDKLDCFLATMDAIVLDGEARVLSAYLNHDGEWDAKLAAALEAVAAATAAQPAAARLYYVESYAAGPEAVAKVEATSDRLDDIVSREIERSPLHAGAPRELRRAVLRGVRGIFQSRLRTGREHELPEIVPQLLAWALRYHAPPRPLRPAGRPSRDLFPMPAANPDDPRERILDAVLALMAEHGYERLAVTDVAQRAGVSLAAFYDRFAGKDEAVGAAFRRSANRVVKVTAPAFRAAPDWPRGIAAAIDALLAYLVIERPFAGFRGIDVRLGSRLVVDVRRQLLAAAQPFAAEGFRQHGDVQPIAGEAIGASIDALLFDQSANWGTERLYDAAPIATYIALVPFVGVEQACAIATSSRSPASR